MTNREKIKFLCREAEEFNVLLRRNNISFEKVCNFVTYTSPFHPKYVDSKDFSVKETDRLGDFCAQKNKYLDVLRRLYDKTSSAEVGHAVASALFGVIETYVALSKWSEGKISFNFKSELSDILYDSMDDENKAIPVEIFKHLPYNKFFIDTSCIPATEESEFLNRTLGVIIEVSTPQYIADVPALSFNYITNKENRGIGNHKINIALNEDLTIGDLVKELDEDMERSYQNNKNILGDYVNKNYEEQAVKNAQDNMRKDFVQTNEDLKRMCSYVISQLIYLSIKEPEMKPNGQTEAFPPKKKSDTVQRYTVGEEFAIKVRNYINEQSAQKPHMGNSYEEALWRMPPHLRRAHYHHYWVGSDQNPEKNGPRRLELRWMEPIFVNAKYKDHVKPSALQVENEQTEDGRDDI